MAYRITHAFSGERPGRRTPCITDDQFIQRSFATMLERSRVRCGLQADSHFLRDNHGAEVDLLFEYFGKLHAVKIDSSQYLLRTGCTGRLRWQRYAAAVAAAPVVVYGGCDSYHDNGVHVMAWRKLGG